MKDFLQISGHFGFLLYIVDAPNLVQRKFRDMANVF